MINALAIYSESAANFPLQVVCLACLTAGALVRLPERLRPAIAKKHAVPIRQFQDSDVVLPEDAARLDRIDTRAGADRHMISVLAMAHSARGALLCDEASTACSERVALIHILCRPHSRKKSYTK